MGKPSGFLDWKRAEPHRRDIAERLHDWREVEHVGDDSKPQAGRCMDCGVPFCTNGCPLGNPIPDFADAIWRGRWEEAYRKLAVTNDFPEFTGRLCPAPCEAACVLAIASPALPGEAAPPNGGAGSMASPALPGEAAPPNGGAGSMASPALPGEAAPPNGGAGSMASPALPGEAAPPNGGAGSIDGAPVTIEALERSIAERAFTEGWVTTQHTPRTGKRVAVVGSGPAGLAAAVQLDARGHSVTVFEAASRAGGLLRYGIPDFKLEKHVIDRRLARTPDIAIRCNADIGTTLPWNALVADHDATIIAIGAQRPRELVVPGRELAGVLVAMDYLVDQNEATAGDHAAVHGVRGKRVIILGGGDTGSDCLGTALRQGAAEVTQIELVPAPPIGRNPATPWPAWPLVFRMSSSQEEGGTRTFGFRTTHLEGAAGRLVALHGISCERRDGELFDLPGTDVRIACDVLILALGFIGPAAHMLVEQLGVRLDARGNIEGDEALATNVRGVFCAGDARRGASLVVWAIAEGRRAAHSVHRMLSLVPR